MTLTRHQRWLLDLARRAGDKYYNPATGLCLIVRDTVWYAISLLLDDSPRRRKLGNELLTTLASEDGTHTPATMLAILDNLPGTLTAAAKENLYQNIRRELVHAADVQWRDGNVNHPLGAYCTLIRGGELCNESWATELGLHRLREFQQTIGDRQHRERRQAEMSEYNSPTYSALDLWFLALIAEHAGDKEAAKLALFLEQRLWLDVAMHFHAPSQQFAGPHSRAYQDDSTGGFSALHCTMLAAFDQELYLNPELPFRFEHISNLVENALIAIVKFHVPETAKRIAWNKPYPYYFQKTTYCEQYHENAFRLQTGRGGGSGTGGSPASAGEAPFAFDDEVYPGGWRDLTTYHTAEYALGTSSLPYVNAGHADAFVLRIRRAPRIGGMKDFRSAYSRGVYNGAVVGQSNFCHIAGRRIDASYLYEEGRSAIYQHRNRAMVCYTAKRSGHLGVKSFRLDLIFSYFAPFDRLLLGAEPAGPLPARYAAETRLYFQDYRTYGAVIPLTPRPAASDTPLRVWTANDHLMFSAYAYEGPIRDFARDEISSWHAGFVIELATADEFASFDEYVDYATALYVEEEVEPRGTWRVTLKTGENTMKLCLDPMRERIVSRRWNGAEERILHFHCEAATTTEGVDCPATLFGSEASDESI